MIGHEKVKHIFFNFFSNCYSTENYENGMLSTYNLYPFILNYQYNYFRMHFFKYFFPDIKKNIKIPLFETRGRLAGRLEDEVLGCWVSGWA